MDIQGVSSRLPMQYGNRREGGKEEGRDGRREGWVGGRWQAGWGQMLYFLNSWTNSIHINMELILTTLCQCPSAQQYLGILGGCEQPTQDNLMLPTEMQQHEMPMFLLQQNFSIKIMMTGKYNSTSINYVLLVYNSVYTVRLEGKG
jgi:hypothetical protein